MNKTLTINTALPGKARARVLIIYTGGTFGMISDASGVLKPFDFSHILEHLPALRGLQLELRVISFETPIDSSNIAPAHWQEIAKIIWENYALHDGFVVLHGTDTMAYTSSALSFMFRDLSKSIILTGAQLPISESRSDARENLITSLEIASTLENGVSMVPEVGIYFGDQLIRGCRAKKVESMHFDAFQSENYPVLARAGVKIEYNRNAIRPISSAPTTMHGKFDSGVAVLKLFPGMSRKAVEAVLTHPEVRAVVLETFGSGNAPTEDWFLSLLKSAIGRGLILLNISQCPGGMVQQGRYETSKALQAMGVIGGADMTLEAAVTKLMLVLGEFGPGKAKEELERSWVGERV